MFFYRVIVSSPPVLHDKCAKSLLHLLLVDSHQLLVSCLRDQTKSIIVLPNFYCMSVVELPRKHLLFLSSFYVHCIVRLPIATHLQSFRIQNKHISRENIWISVPCSFQKLFRFSCFILTTTLLLFLAESLQHQHKGAYFPFHISANLHSSFHRFIFLDFRKLASLVRF